MRDVLDLVLQFTAAGLLLVGLYAMGNRRLIGPALAAGSELLWIVAFIPHAVWGGVFLSTILFGMQVRNFVKWYKEGIR